MVFLLSYHGLILEYIYPLEYLSAGPGAIETCIAHQTASCPS